MKGKHDSLLARWRIRLNEETTALRKALNEGDTQEINIRNARAAAYGTCIRELEEAGSIVN